MNNNWKQVIRGFNVFEKCFEFDQINQATDIFQLERTSNDGVCITSLFVNGEQILVGMNNDMQSFWIDGDQNKCLFDFTGTTEITIQNGTVNSSHCTTAGKNLESNE